MTQITAEVLRWEDLMHAGRYAVPWHQRHYDWSRENVEELLADLQEAMAAGQSSCFLGAVLLVRTAQANQRGINDGQQRFITLSLLTAALGRSFDRPPRDADRSARARWALFDGDGARIEVPQNDRMAYSQMLDGRDIGASGPLASAWSAVESAVQPMDAAGRREFFDFVMRGVEIAVVEMPAEADAHAAFEALNARGKPLDDMALLRNRLYSHFSEPSEAHRRQAVHGHLSRISLICGGAGRSQAYCRCQLQCRYGHIRKSRFYREARRRIGQAGGEKAADYAFDLAADLGKPENAELFRTLTAPKASPAIERLLPKVGGRGAGAALQELRGYSVAHPLTFALLRRFLRDGGDGRTGEAVAQSLRNLASFVMRVVLLTPKFEPSKLEAAFANRAQTIFAGQDADSLGLLDMLQGCDEWGALDDAEFVRRATAAEFRDGRRALRCLHGLETGLAEGVEIKIERCCVEAVLPQTPNAWKDWPAFQGERPETWVRRAGNLVLLPQRELPANAAEQTFADKRRRYADSALNMPRGVADFDAWTPSRVEARSLEIAQAAAKLWSFG